MNYNRQTDKFFEPYTGVCGFFLSFKFATSLLASLTKKNCVLSMSLECITELLKVCYNSTFSFSSVKKYFIVFPHIDRQMLGLILSTKIWVLRNFMIKIWKFWTHQFFQKIWEIFRQNILVRWAWTGPPAQPC